MRDGGRKDATGALVLVSNMKMEWWVGVPLRKNSQMRTWSPVKVILFSEDLNPRFLLTTCLLFMIQVCGCGIREANICVPKIMEKQTSYLLQGSQLQQRCCKSQLMDVHHGKSVLVSIPHYSPFIQTLFP